MLSASIEPWGSLPSSEGEADLRPPPGFRTHVGGQAALMVRSGDQRLFVFRLRTFVRAIPGRPVRAAVIAASAAKGINPELDERDLDDLYRVVLDALTRASPRPDAIRIFLESQQNKDLNVVRSLALGLDAKCVIGESDGRISVDLYLPWLGGTIAGALALVRTENAFDNLRSAWSAVRVPRGSAITSDKTELWFLLDLTLETPVLQGPRDLRFTEVSHDELQRRPWRHGLSLRGGAAFPPADHLFIGTIGDALAFRIRVITDQRSIAAQVPRAVFAALGDGAVLLTFGYTFPRFRGQGILPAALGWIAERAREWGSRRILLSVLANNASSLKAVRKAGYVPIPPLAEPPSAN